jgi:hypothetical protein
MKNLLKRILVKFKLGISIKQLIKEWAVYSLVKAIIFILIFALLAFIIYLIKSWFIADKSFWIVIGIITFLILTFFDVYSKLLKMKYEKIEDKSNDLIIPNKETD